MKKSSNKGNIRAVAYVLGRKNGDDIIYNRSIGMDKRDKKGNTYSINRITAEANEKTGIPLLQFWLSNGEEEVLWKETSVAQYEIEYDVFDILNND